MARSTPEARPRRGSVSRTLGAAGLALALLAPAAALDAQQAALPKVSKELEAVREGLAKYLDPNQATLENFVAIGCIDYGDLPPSPEENSADYLNKSGEVVMVHYGHATSGALDPTMPSALIYERPADGPLVLAGVIWMVPAKPGVERPKLFGQEFAGPMVAKSTTPLVRVDFTQYELHAWLWTENPEGLHARFNPLIPCITDGYEIRSRPLKP
jgi:hypothetical protein